jgi:hypothetical protein
MFVVGGNHQALRKAGERRQPEVDAQVLHFLRDACKQEPVTKQDVQVKATETAKSLGKTDFKTGHQVGATYLFAFKDCRSGMEQSSLKNPSDTSSSYLSIYLSIYLWLYSPFVRPWTLFQFLNFIHSQ